MAYVAVSVLCLFLTHSYTHFLWRMWLLVVCVSCSLIHILFSYGVCGCKCSLSLPHSFTYSLLMAYVAVSVLCLFFTHSHTHFLWRMWVLVFYVYSSLIHILTLYGVCGCKCIVSPPHSLTYSLLMAYVAVSVLCLFLTHSHTHFLWRMWLLAFCVSSSLIYYSLLMAYVAIIVLCLFLTHLNTSFLLRMWL